MRRTSALRQEGTANYCGTNSDPSISAKATVGAVPAVVARAIAPDIAISAASVLADAAAIVTAPAELDGLDIT